MDSVTIRTNRTTPDGRLLRKDIIRTDKDHSLRMVRLSGCPVFIDRREP
jgi:hypothetical protein